MLVWVSPVAAPVLHGISGVGSWTLDDMGVRGTGTPCPCSAEILRITFDSPTA